MSASTHEVGKKKLVEFVTHTISNKKQSNLQFTLIVTFPFVTFLMLKPTVGIISSLNWPDCKIEINVIIISTEPKHYLKSENTYNEV